MYSQSNIINHGGEILLLRRNLLRESFSGLANPRNKANFAIYGLPRTGKTSILNCLSNVEVQQLFERESDQTLSRHIFVNIDLNAYLEKSFEGFFEILSRDILWRSRDQLQLSYNPGLGADGFIDILEQINLKHFHPVLLMDMFDEIVRNKQIYSILGFLRAQAMMDRVSYVTASNVMLTDICRSQIKDSPFANIFKPMSIGALTQEEAINLIETIDQIATPRFLEEKVEWILNHAGRNPCLIQRVCHFLLKEKEANQTNGIDMKKIEGPVYRDLQEIFTGVWSQLTEAERAIFQREAQQKGNENRQYPEFSESSFFRQFVRNTTKIGLFKMTVDELEKALKNMYNLADLGQTNLRLLKVVGQRLDGNISPTSIETGKIIRDIMREALERLRGPDMRTDADPKWYSYNILNYRYFSRFPLKHREIAARLEFTNDRQYYRKHSEAVMTLLRVFFEMEELD